MQYAPQRVDPALQAAIATANIRLDSARNVAAIQQAQAERQQRMQLAQLEIQAQRERDARMFEQRALEQQRDAENTAKRDAQLDSYDLHRMDRQREWNLYDKTSAETGMSPAAIRAKSIETGRPYEELYSVYSQARKQKAEEQTYQRKLDYVRDSAQVSTDIEEEKVKKKIRGYDDYWRDVQNDPTMSPTAKQELGRQIEFKKREAAAGIKLPEPFDPKRDLEQKVQVDPRTGTSRYRTKDGEWRADSRSAKGESFETVDDVEVDDYLNKKFAGQYLDENGFTIEGQPGPEDKATPKTSEHASPDQRFEAKLKIMAQKQEAQLIQGMIADVVKKTGVLPSVAAEHVLKQMRERTSDFAIGQAQQEAGRLSKEQNVAAARGEPGPASRPAPDEEVRTINGHRYRKIGQEEWEQID